MSDVLTLSITLDDGKYASENNKYEHGLAWGKKSGIYKKVEREVKSAAEREMKRIGWRTADCECLFAVTRIMPKRWRADAMNLGTPEANALTKAGVWTDDRLGQPSLLWVRHDPAGQHRIIIIVQKLHRPANVFEDERRPYREMPDEIRVPVYESVDAVAPTGNVGKISLAQTIARWRPGMVVPEGYAVENGRTLVPIEDAVRRMR